MSYAYASLWLLSRILSLLFTKKQTVFTVIESGNLKYGEQFWVFIIVYIYSKLSNRNQGKHTHIINTVKFPLIVLMKRIVIFKQHYTAGFNKVSISLYTYVKCVCLVKQ